jgi:Family of unknown function (DUF6498)
MSGVSSSALMLLGVNLGIIAAAFFGDWSLPTILASYVAQSVIIGLFQAKKMADLKVFSTEGLKMNDQPVDPTPATRRKVVVFFLIHYGGFHAAYFGFVFTAGRPEWLAVAGSSLLFFGNHLFSYFSNRAADSKRVPNIGTMMFAPYIRILPMHLFIVFGALVAGGRNALVVFMLLKTLADETMHLVEHKSGMAVG